MSDETVAALNAGGRGALMEKMGLEWLEASPERLVARVPAEGNTQPLGVLHGGASAALAETIASVGAWLADTSKVALGIEIAVHHLRKVSAGWVTGVGTPLHRGRSVHVWEIRLTDDEGLLVAFATCTVAIRSPGG